MRKVLVVGGGRQGRRHIRAAATAGAEVCGLVDAVPSPDLSIPQEHDIDTAIERFEPDVVVLATPTATHAALATRALHANVLTLIEKPVTADVEEALGLLDHPNASRVYVGHVERFNPAVGLVRQLLSSSRFGEVISMSFRRVGLPPSNAPDVDVLHDLAVHDIDVFRLLVPGDAKLRGVTGWRRGTLLEAAQVLLECCGVGASIQANWRTPVRIREFSVTTDEAYIDVNYTTQQVEIIDRQAPVEFEEFVSMQSHYGAARRVAMEVQQHEPLVEQMRELLGILDGRVPDRLATLPDGMAALQLAASASIEAGRA